MRYTHLNGEEINSLLDTEYSFYSHYLEWLLTDDEDDRLFSIKKVYCLTSLPEETIPQNAKMKYVESAKKKVKGVVDDFYENDLDSFLVINEYDHHEYKQYPWIHPKFSNDDLVRANSKYLIGANGSVDEVMTSRGHKCNGNLLGVFETIYFLPFYMGYLDVDILFPKKDFLIKIDHHLTVLRIELHQNSNADSAPA